MVKIDETTFTICDGPNRAIRALLASRGLKMPDIIPPLVRRVDDLLFRDAGTGYIRHDPMELDRETRQQLEAMNEKMRRILRASTYNPPINWGASIMWDRMGQKLDREAINKALDFLGIKNGGGNHE